MTHWEKCPPHYFVSGDTGAGKTTIAKQMFFELDRIGLFIDPLKVVENAAVAESVQEVKRLYSSGEVRVIFRPHWDDSEAAEQIKTLVDYIFRLAEKLDMGFLVCVDEVHNFASKGGNSSPIVRLHKEGRNYDIKTISISQEPQTVHHSVLRQSWHIWLGGVNKFAVPYLENYHLPINEIEQNGKHDALVLNSNMEVVERTKAKSKYA